MMGLKPRTEDPVRIRAFKQTMSSLNWNPDDLAASLNALFGAVDDLADAELRYYNRRRQTRAWVSGLTRLGAWVLGSIGIVIPLLAATHSEPFQDMAGYGYVFLALSGSCLAANALFGGTDGHIRFVTTQLEIEKIMTKARVDWCEYQAGQNAGAMDVAAGFEKLRTYAHDLHVVTIAETGRWGESLLQALSKYEQRVAPRPKP